MQPPVNDFLKTILRSGVLDAGELAVACRQLPREQRYDPCVLADHLIRTGKLSRFQASKLLVGRAKGLVMEPYQVLAPIGRGGMGAVYLARDSRNQQLVALKVLPPNKARRQERLLARFRREMDLCRRVAHPHIAQTFEVGVKQGVYYIAMEFIPGIDLSKLVRENGPLPVPRAARLFVEVAQGLHHAHQQGLVHRDIKPSNIRVTPSDRAKVLDLGLALIEGEDISEREVVGGQGYIVGSMDYIAPEQTFDACAVDGRADIYGMGCSLYFALTGKPPFPGGSAKEKILRHRGEEPALLTERNPDVPARFAELVHHMMAKDPDKRLARVEMALQELMAWSPSVTELPADRHDDSVFRQAVESLQAAEVDDDLEAIPVAEPVDWQRWPLALWLAGGAVAAGVLLIVVIILILLLSQ
ncbi:MAG TPA: serine/threonine-protein kinase [Gemmataceae bacterium]|nr:serine/threonine-protein kinase [Gemmataceae bacterium]